MGQDGPMIPPRATLAVRVKPGSSRTRVGGRYDGAHGPATSAVRLRTGRTGRDEVLDVDLPPEDLATRVAALRDGPER
jgi:hypothetical protein